MFTLKQESLVQRSATETYRVLLYWVDLNTLRVTLAESRGAEGELSSVQGDVALWSEVGWVELTRLHSTVHRIPPEEIHDRLLGAAAIILHL